MGKPSKEAKTDPWKEKARQEILTHLQDRAWVKHFLEKHVWLTHRTAYPSVAGSAFSDISDKIKERQFDSGVKYVFVDEKHLTREFMERVGRINSHISSENHSKTLEVLLALALIIINLNSAKLTHRQLRKHLHDPSRPLWNPRKILSPRLDNLLNL